MENVKSDRWYKYVSEVKIGDKVNSPRYGLGIVIGATARTVTVQFNAAKVKNTYPSKSSRFLDTDF